MAASSKEVKVSIMQAINEGHKPEYDEYGMTKREFYEIVEEIQKAGYSIEAKFFRDKERNIYNGNLNHMKLTEAGLKYLSENA